MIFVVIFVGLTLIGMVTIAIVNTFTFPRLGQAAKSGQQPLVSLLIPARNEANGIANTIRSLLTQTYLNFEIIVLDDNSTDGTANAVRDVAGSSSRLQIVSGNPLPSEWLGKNWACHQLSQLAKGDVLVFTDADVSWAPQALSSLVAEIEQTQADLLTIWSTQKTQSWTERLTVPLMAFAIIGYLPLPLVHFTPWSIFAAANGQCLAFRRHAYQTIRGHRSVQSEVLEDVILSRHIKRNGFKLRMVDGAGQITCRMYENWSAVRDGFAKNILAGYGDRVSILLLATIFHWMLFWGPWLWLAFGWLAPVAFGWPLTPLILISLGVGLRALTAAVTQQRLTDALLMPVSVLLMTRIAFQAIWWKWRFGGPRWKGRTITSRQSSSEKSYG